MAKKKDVTVVSIGAGTMPAKKLKEMKKAEMAMGGMANGKKHMYLANGGSVTDNLPNPGLKALAKTKGKTAVRNMGFDVNGRKAIYYPA